MAKNVLEIIVQAKDEFSSDMKKVSKQLDDTSRTLTEVGRSFTIAGAAVSAAIGIQVKAAADFQVQMANVNTMLDEQTSKFLPQYQKGLLDVSMAFGESTATLSKGLYDILSASIPATEAMDVLNVSVKAAKAGMTDTGIAADAITTIINSYGLAASKAGDVSDWLFAIVKRGKTTFAELAPTIGGVASIAATAGLSLEEVGASLATMTRAGISTDEAVTSLRATMNAFLKPSEQAQIAAKDLGVTLSSNTLRSEGLISVVDKLSGASTEQAAAIFGSIRAFKGMATLLQQTTGFTSDLEFMFNRAGKTQEAFNKVSLTFSFTMARVREAIKVVWVEVGSTLLPILNKLAISFLGIIARGVAWIRENQKLVKGIALGASAFAIFVTVLGTTALALGGTIRMALQFAKALKTMRLLVIAFKATAFPEIMLVAGAIIALVGVGILLIKNWGKIKDWAKIVFERVKDYFMSLADIGKGVALIFKGKFKEGFNSIKDASGDLKDKLVDDIEGFNESVFNGVEGVKNFFKDMVGGMKDSFENLTGDISDIAEETFTEDIPSYFETLMEETLLPFWEDFKLGFGDAFITVRDLGSQIFSELSTTFGTMVVDMTKGVTNFQALWQGVLDGLLKTFATSVAQMTLLWATMQKKKAADTLAWKVIEVAAAGAVAVAGAVASAFKHIPFPASIVVAGVAIAAVATMFSKIKKFAQGGIVTKPTLGMVGEAGPEAIIPLNKLKGASSVNISNINIQFPGVTNLEDFRQASPSLIKDLVETKIFDAFKLLAREGKMDAVVQV